MRARFVADARAILPIQFHRVKLSIQRACFGGNKVNLLMRFVDPSHLRHFPIAFGEAFALLPFQRVKIQVTKAVPLAAPQELILADKAKQVVVVDPIRVATLKGSHEMRRRSHRPSTDPDGSGRDSSARWPGAWNRASNARARSETPRVSPRSIQRVAPPDAGTTPTCTSALARAGLRIAFGLGEGAQSGERYLGIDKLVRDIELHVGDALRIGRPPISRAQIQLFGIHPIHFAIQQRGAAVVGEPRKLAAGDLERIKIVAAPERHARAIGRKLGIVLRLRAWR